MEKILLFVFLLISINLCYTSKSSATAKISHIKTPVVQSMTDAFEYLSELGYNPCRSQTESNASVESTVLCQSSTASMLKKFQARFRLPTTGKLDRETLRALNAPRCGMSDDPYAPLSFKVAIGWPKKSFTWKLRTNKFIPSMGVHRVRQQIREAFNDWAKHAPLSFQEIPENETADFDIAFVDKYHKEGRDFARFTTILAYAHLPISGLIRFSSVHNWIDKYDSTGFNIRLVATHEIGHALGLYHSSDRSAIMFEQYQLMKPESLLPKDDRQGIQALYGTIDQSTNTTSTTTQKTPITTNKRTMEREQDLRPSTATPTTFSSTTKARTPDPYDNMIIILRNKATQKVLDSNADKHVYTLDLNGGNYQKWMLIRQYDGTFILRNIATSFALESKNENLSTSYFSGSPRQKWRFQRQNDATYFLQNQATLRVLGSNSTSQTELFDSYHIPDNQKWLLIPTRVGPYNGMIAVLRNKVTQKVLDSNTDKDISALNHNGNNNQRWILSRQEDGSYILGNLQTSYTLEANKERVYVSNFSGDAYQKWRFHRQNDGSYAIQNLATLLALESVNSISKTYSFDSNIRDNQKWFFEGK